MTISLEHYNKFTDFSSNKNLYNNSKLRIYKVRDVFNSKRCFKINVWKKIYLKKKLTKVHKFKAN